IGRLQHEETTYPITFLVKLVLRDRTDSNEVAMLGQGTLTVTDYTPTPVETTTDLLGGSSTSNTATGGSADTSSVSNASSETANNSALPAASEAAAPEALATPENSILKAKSIETDSSSTINKKVRRSPEAILVLPASTESPSAGVKSKTVPVGTPIDVVEPVEPA
ncbi:hypothetical protein IT411_03625, partial [Candidatus Peregrinibacteria bacterium]|nr:hypothetical protein [Candidatus Peregrinibacteria bacterium]